MDRLAPGLPPLADRWFNLWHGTTSDFALRLQGSRIAPIYSRPGLDFGAGFYTTSNKKQAQSWANLQARTRPGGIAALIMFKVYYAELAVLRQVSFIRSDRSAMEFWTFVQRMRTGAFDCHFEGGYFDMVCGPISLKPGRFRAMPDSDQFSFHGPRGYDFINACEKVVRIAGGTGRFVT